MVNATDESNKDSTLTLNQIRELAKENSRQLLQARLQLENANVAKDYYTNQYLDVRDARRAASINSNPLSRLVGKSVQNIEALQNQLAQTPPGSAEFKFLEMQIALQMQQVAVLGSVGGAGVDLVGMEEKTEKGKDQAKDTYENAKDLVRDAEKRVELASEQLYLQALQLQDVISIYENKSDLEMRILNVEKLMKEKGLSIDTQVTQKAVNASDTAKSLRFYRQQYQTILMAINDLIGRDTQEPLTLQKVTVQIAPVNDYNQIIESAIANSATIDDEKRKIERNRDDLDNLLSRSDEYKMLAISNELSNTKIDEEIFNIKTSVETLLAQLSEKSKTYELAKVQMDKSETIWHQEQLRCELGLISKLDLEGARLQWQNAQRDYEVAAHNYYLALRKVQLAEEGVILK